MKNEKLRDLFNTYPRGTVFRVTDLIIDNSNHDGLGPNAYMVLEEHGLIYLPRYLRETIREIITDGITWDVIKDGRLGVSLERDYVFNKDYYSIRWHIIKGYENSFDADWLYNAMHRTEIMPVEPTYEELEQEERLIHKLYSGSLYGSLAYNPYQE